MTRGMLLLIGVGLIVIGMVASLQIGIVPRSREAAFIGLQFAGIVMVVIGALVTTSGLTKRS